MITSDILCNPSPIRLSTAGDLEAVNGLLRQVLAL